MFSFHSTIALHISTSFVVYTRFSRINFYTKILLNNYYVPIYQFIITRKNNRERPLGRLQTRWEDVARKDLEMVQENVQIQEPM